MTSTSRPRVRWWRPSSQGAARSACRLYTTRPDIILAVSGSRRRSSRRVEGWEEGEENEKEEW